MAHISISVAIACSLAVISGGLRISTEQEPEKTLCHNAIKGVHRGRSHPPPYGTNCPQDDWVDAMVDEDRSTGKVIMSIGCNKGQDAIRWMQRWDAQNAYNMTKWMQHERYQKLLRNGRHGRGFACPVDYDYQTITSGDRSAGGDTGSKPIGVCADLLKSNVDLVTRIAEDLGYVGDSAPGTFHIVHGAFTDHIGENKTVNIQEARAGTETVHMKGKVKKHEIDVEVMTVDSITARLELPKVDILTIDTEGFDPAVLKGATSTLDSIRYLEFEVHRDFTSTPWGTTSVKEVMLDLDQKGFECYWAGNNGKLLSMNRCWNDRFEKGTWANAACVKRGDAWASVLERFAMA